MKWEEVRRLYPAQYVKLNILDYYIKDDKKIVTDVALIDLIQDPKLAIKELLKSKGNVIVYPTEAEKIIIEMRNPVGLRGLKL